MDVLKNILIEITRLTTNIKVNYPELYRTLNENPLTVPSEEHPQIDIEIMKSYLESLKQLLKHHLETRKTA